MNLFLAYHFEGKVCNILEGSNMNSRPECWTLPLHPPMLSQLASASLVSRLVEHVALFAPLAVVSFSRLNLKWCLFQNSFGRAPKYATKKSSWGLLPRCNHVHVSAGRSMKITIYCIVPIDILSSYLSFPEVLMDLIFIGKHLFHKMLLFPQLLLRTPPRHPQTTWITHNTWAMNKNLVG